jgi:hypothetical protein
VGWFDDSIVYLTLYRVLYREDERLLTYTAYSIISDIIISGEWPILQARYGFLRKRHLGILAPFIGSILRNASLFVLANGNCLPVVGGWLHIRGTRHTVNECNGWRHGDTVVLVDYSCFFCLAES